TSGLLYGTTCGAPRPLAPHKRAAMSPLGACLERVARVGPSPPTHISHPVGADPVSAHPAPKDPVILSEYKGSLPLLAQRARPGDPTRSGASGSPFSPWAHAPPAPRPPRPPP